VNNPTLFHCYSFKPNCATTLFNQRDSAAKRYIAREVFTNLPRPELDSSPLAA
jgi:hypothetical protein